MFNQLPPILRPLFSRRRSIRFHILNLFFLSTALVIIITGVGIYHFVHSTMRNNMMEKLATSTLSVKEVVENAANLAIRNHLQTIAQVNIDTLRFLEGQVQVGALSRAEAQDQAERLFLQQHIGDQGYVYVINSQGRVKVHPAASLIGKDISHRSFIRQQIARKSGLLDYTWKNPGESSTSPKTLAMAYFQPWDWIVSVTCYQHEFNFLARDLRKGLNAHHFGRTGYAFIFSGSGDVIQHPWMVGNVNTMGNPAAKRLFERMLAQKNGQLVYTWKDSSQEKPQRKIVFFNYIQELDWIVASTVYEEEFLQPLARLSWIIGFIILIALVLVLPLGLTLGNLIANPLARLAGQMAQAVGGDLDVLAEEDGLGEIGELGHHFNRYILRLSQVNQDLLEEIRERKGAEEQLLLYRNAVEQALEGIVITDAQGNILTINQAFSDITRYTPEDTLGKNVRMFKNKRHEISFYLQLLKELKQTGRWSGESWNSRKTGEDFPQILSISAIRDQGNRVTHYVGLFHDITELKRQKEHIVHQAYHDSLTGLPNRRLAMDRIEVSIAHVRRGGTRLVVLILDLDNFKKINDSLGHASGDTLLLQVTNRLVAQVREEDTVARLGGDEFLLLMAAITSEDVVPPLIERLLKSMAAPFQVDGQEVFVSASIGAAFYPNDGSNAETLIKHADIAMYQAKSQGKNSACLFTPDLSERISYLRELENNLRQAVQNREFTVFFQPKVDPFSERIVGAEALVRWQQADGSLVSPADFIPLAEETGLIIPLGELVLEQTCRFLSALNAAKGPALILSVNLSSQQFVQENLVERILDILQTFNLPSSQLELEITETAMMKNLAKTIDTLNELVGHGFAIAIDDFGTGYSSLSYLKRFPIKTLKIDRSFIRDITEDPSDAQLVETIILMAHNLGIPVVAEGVETADQLAWLKRCGCEQIQGFYYSKPLNSEDFLAYLSDFS
ncbi:EAL domain-containing protein [Desulfobulbus rhabdoformis]|uniref:bifunctional diguanylate cyclase/phosphodiesterase n=1 Tax=Desulfobulbus rhabdoformis TaxID=34032 RepID=UPI0019652FD8|nr:EAL domain-containing protein [Desulfobulbus rhabdoformis]MBM9614912.1 EAL domain-containing protein [Desulfobulbus rhabdoformis]